MHILITGGTGVVGAAAVSELLRRGHRVRLLSRHSDEDAKRWNGVEAFQGDVSDASSIRGAAEGCDATLHIAGVSTDDEELLETVNVSGTRNIVAEAQRAGARRFVFVSSLGSGRGSSRYHRSKRAAEEIVRQSPLQWTILRPGNVFGPSDDVISRLLEMIRALPALPVIGDGEQPFQPIWHEDLAAALAETIARDDLAGQTLEVGGVEITSTADLIERLATITGRDPMRVPLPERAVAAATAIGEAAGVPVPVDTTKLTMLHEHNVISGSNALIDVLRIEPTTLDTGLRMLTESLPEQLPDKGVGSLQHKRFFADIEGPRVSAVNLMRLFRDEGLSLIPIEFNSETGTPQRIVPGATLTGTLPLRGTFQIRVELAEAARVVMVTVEGHPFAGFIEVWAEEHGKAVRFAIDVYARAANLLDLAAMKTIGVPMQSSNWVRTVQGIIERAGGTAPAGVQTESESLDADEAERATNRIRALVRKRQRDESGSPAERAPQR
jgi:NADH dehydrogenase